MGAWTYSTFLRCAEANAVRREIMWLLERCHFAPCPRPKGGWEGICASHFRDEPHVRVAVMGGKTAWTLVDTSPPELMGDRIGKKGKKRPFLGCLCKRLHCDGFMYNVYDEDTDLVMEAVPTGHCAVSGADYTMISEGHFEDYRGTKADKRTSGFIWVDVPRPVKEIIEGRVRLSNGLCEADDVIRALMLGVAVGELCDHVGKELVLALHGQAALEVRSGLQGRCADDRPDCMYFRKQVTI